MEILTALKVSLKVSATSTVFVVLTGSFVAYFFSLKNFKGKNILEGILTLPMILPPTVIGYYLILLLGKQGLLGKTLYEQFNISILFSWQAAAIASFIVSFPLMFKTIKSAIDNFDRNLLYMSYSLGHSEIKTFFRVLIPQIRKNVLAGAILSFTRALGEFGATLMVAGSIPGKTTTMSVLIYSYVSSGEYEKTHLIVLFFSIFCLSIVFISIKLIGK